MNGRERCLAAIRGEPVDRTPVFPLLMFLAADRAGLTYREYATDGRALAEAQLAAAERFGLDAVTACSDAFRLAADLGARMSYPEQATPHALEPLVSAPADLAALRRPDPLTPGSRMADRVRAVAELVRGSGRERLVLGWVDLPFAEACSACGVAALMTLLYDEPAFLHALLERLTPLVIDFALAQLEAGAPMIGAGDAAASLVSPAFYREFALPYERRVIEAVHAPGRAGEAAHLRQHHGAPAGHDRGGGGPVQRRPPGGLRPGRPRLRGGRPGLQGQPRPGRRPGLRLPGPRAAGGAAAHRAGGGGCGAGGRADGRPG